MKTIIYYFTGTGNSLAAARKIAAALGDCEMISIASLQNKPGDIVPAAERVGIVCPVYDAGLPHIVAECAGRLDLSQTSYSFGIVTLGGTGVSALHQLNGIVSRKNGKMLDAAFIVKMPGNFPPVGKIASPEKQQEILNAADARLAEIAGLIGKGAIVPPGFSPVSSLMRAIVYPPFFRNVHGMDKDFSVTSACTSCGTCMKVCPVENIVMLKDRPSWLHHCELCCACLHFCPAEAIQLNVFFGSKGRGRYRHPDVKVPDMKAQKGEQV
ncbi:EFR1 family ferrodoxin [Methanoregula sp.]|uniref:EFR1 family ferrodoxin n=1 Tax=Methanoregula sp. TaxID=2052170 RepID=UPI003C75075E